MVCVESLEESFEDEPDWLELESTEGVETLFVLLLPLEPLSKAVPSA